MIGYLKGGTKHESIGAYSGLPFVPDAIPSQRETASWIGSGPLSIPSTEPRGKTAKDLSRFRNHATVSKAK